MKILFEDNHLLVVIKPMNVPTQADSSKDEDLLTMAKNYLKIKYQKPGNVYCGLIHRLDRPVSGLVVLAKTSKAASRLSNQMRLNQFEKQYMAICEGKVEEGTWIDYLIKNAKTNTSYTTTQNKGKYSELRILKSVQINEHQSLVTIDLKTGRPHQIRVQCASRQHPIVNDQRYHPDPIKNQQIKLLAHSLSFYHPVSKEKLLFTMDIPSSFFK